MARDQSPSVRSSLLDRLRDGSSVAWNELVYLYRPVVLNWCRKKSVPDDSAEDITQEVFRAVLKNLGSFRRDEAHHSFRGWLWTITKFKLADYWRKQSGEPVGRGGSDAHRQMVQLADEIRSLDHQPCDAKEVRGILGRVLELIKKRIDATTFRAFWLTTVDGIEPGLVANELGLSRTSVYTAKSRVLRRLREELRELEPDEVLVSNSSLDHH